MSCPNHDGVCGNYVLVGGGEGRNWRCGVGEGRWTTRTPFSIMVNFGENQHIQKDKKAESHRFF
jgi:hypothetical protein